MFDLTQFEMISRFLQNSHLIRTFKPVFTYGFPFHSNFSVNVNKEVVSSDDNADLSYSVFQSEVSADDPKKEKNYSRPLGKYRYTRKYLLPQAEKSKNYSKGRRYSESSRNKVFLFIMNIFCE